MQRIVFLKNSHNNNALFQTLSTPTLRVELRAKTNFTQVVGLDFRIAVEQRPLCASILSLFEQECLLKLSCICPTIHCMLGVWGVNNFLCNSRVLRAREISHGDLTLSNFIHGSFISLCGHLFLFLSGVKWLDHVVFVFLWKKFNFLRNCFPLDLLQMI